MSGLALYGLGAVLGIVFLYKAYVSGFYADEVPGLLILAGASGICFFVGKRLGATL